MQIGRDRGAGELRISLILGWLRLVVLERDLCACAHVGWWVDEAANRSEMLSGRMESCTDERCGAACVVRATCRMFARATEIAMEGVLSLGHGHVVVQRALQHGRPLVDPEPRLDGRLD